MNRALRKLGWRQVALSALIFVLSFVFGAGGGIIFRPGEFPSDVVYDVLIGRWLWAVLPIVYAIMVADEAHADGTSPVTAYGLALLIGISIAGLMDILGQNMVGFSSDFRRFQAEHRLFQWGLCVAVYAYWRTTQHALVRVHESEAEHGRHRQQILAARLMALQARVEPHFLFDALSRVGALHERDPAGADALLADLIALLRAMLPVGTTATSTVEREFALAEAWLRAQRHLGSHVEVEIAASPLAAQSGLAPMLLLPLLQEIAGPASRPVAWRLSAELVAAGNSGGRLPCLEVRLAPAGSEATVVGDSNAPSVERVRECLVQLYGKDATLNARSLSDGTAAFALHLPLILELPADDHRSDR